MRLARTKFCGVVKAFWDAFVWNWDVLLHGNPAVDIFTGLKLAAGGELGIGVGEEEWGSGEREVLEGFIERTDGLVDLVVSRFGSVLQMENRANEKPNSINPSARLEQTSTEWQGMAQDPRPSDGVIFSGIGAINRSSVRDISSWVEMLFKYGHNAYGVQDNPSTFRRKRPKNVLPGVNVNTNSTGEHSQWESSQPRQYSGENFPREYQKKLDTSAGIPPPIVASQRPQAIKVNTSASSRDKSMQKEKSKRSISEAEDQMATSTETLMKYLTLGVYGSQWGIPLKRSPVQTQNIKQESRDADTKEPPAVTNINSASPAQEKSHGYFMIGLKGDLEQESITEVEGPDGDVGTDPDSTLDTQSSNNRTMRRTVHVERTPVKLAKSDQPSSGSRECFHFDRRD